MCPKLQVAGIVPMGSPERSMAEPSESHPYLQPDPDPRVEDAYVGLLGLIRPLGLHHVHGQAPNPKAFLKAIGAAPYALRRMLCIRGTRDGVAYPVMKHLRAFALELEDRRSVVLACLGADLERTLDHLKEAALTTQDQSEVFRVALGLQPVLDFEEFKKLEVHYYSGGAEEGQDARDLRRRFDQARSHVAAHVRKHVLKRLPEELLEDPATLGPLVLASGLRDPFGTVEVLRDTTFGRPLARLDVRQRLEILDGLAAFGLGHASNALDLFALPDEPEVRTRLQEVFKADCTAGSSIFGVCAFEGAHHYPFGLRRIDLTLPRRFSSAEALHYLRRNDPPEAKERTFSSLEIGNAITQLQETDVRRFFEQLKGEITLEWKACFKVAKRETIFGDPELKIRNILFLIAHAAFVEEVHFQQLLATLEAALPGLKDDPQRLYVLANRYFFLKILGLNPGQLFAPNGTEEVGHPPIEEVKDYTIRFLLQVGMSIHLHVGETLFQAAPIAWNMLLNQCEGRLELAMQEVAQLFDVFDTLLTLVKPLIPDLRPWIVPLVGALGEGLPELPGAESVAAEGTLLRLTTRAALARHRQTLSQYCLQAIQRRTVVAGVTPATVIQSLRLPRSKTDKLFMLLEQEKKRLQGGGAPAR